MELSDTAYNGGSSEDTIGIQIINQLPENDKVCKYLFNCYIYFVLHKICSNHTIERLHDFSIQGAPERT